MGGFCGKLFIFCGGFCDLSYLNVWGFREKVLASVFKSAIMHSLEGSYAGKNHFKA